MIWATVVAKHTFQSSKHPAQRTCFSLRPFCPTTAVSAFAETWEKRGGARKTTSSTAAPPMRNWRGVAMLCAQRRRMEHLRARMPVSTACSARGVPREDWLPAIGIVLVFFLLVLEIASARRRVWILVSRLELSESGSCETGPALNLGGDILDSDKEKGPGELPLVLSLLILSLRAGDHEGSRTKMEKGLTAGRRRFGL